MRSKEDLWKAVAEDEAKTPLKMSALSGAANKLTMTSTIKTNTTNNPTTAAVATTTATTTAATDTATDTDTTADRVNKLTR